MPNDSATRYGSVTRFFHWSMALLIGWQMLKFFDRIDDGEHWVGQTLVPWHLSIGTLLLLVAARIAWVSRQRQRPAQDAATAPFVRAGHGLLYAAMVAMPVTGILTLLGGGHGWTVFGVELVAEGGEIPWAASIGSLHSPIGWLLLLMVAGHVGMALAHHFAGKKHVMRRMV